MNKRIRELAIESSAMEFGDSVIPATMDIEKFAELIIQECAKTIRMNTGKWTELGYEYYRPSEIADIIEYHFGVNQK